MSTQDVFTNVDIANVVRDEGISLSVQSAKFEGLKHNLTATIAPTVSDDETQGYSKLSHWVTPIEVYICADSSEGAALWQTSFDVGILIDCGTVP